MQWEVREGLEAYLERQQVIIGDQYMMISLVCAMGGAKPPKEPEILRER